MPSLPVYSVGSTLCEVCNTIHFALVVVFHVCVCVFIGTVGGDG